MQSRFIHSGRDYAVGQVAGHRRRYHVIAEPKEGSVDAIPCDSDGGTTGHPQRLSTRTITAHWREEFEHKEDIRIKLEESSARYRQERDQAAKRLEEFLPAFNGIMVDPRDISINGANGPKRDLAEFLRENFTEHQSISVSLSQEAMCLIGDRIRQLAMERTGATWAGG